jgi:phage terminase large subunit GpA-like protein
VRRQSCSRRPSSGGYFEVSNWLSLRVCSPTEDESRIAGSYKDSDQRRASVECPHCRHRQFLEFFKHVD